MEHKKLYENFIFRIQFLLFCSCLFSLIFLHNLDWKKETQRNPATSRNTRPVEIDSKKSWEQFEPVEIPNKNALVKWSNKINTSESASDWAKVKIKTLQCVNSALYPTHPQQTLKSYHVHRVGTYDHFKLSGDDEACSIGAKNKNSKGVKNCFLADSINYVVLSDLFMDSCGNYYRGYYSLLYMKKDDNMGTLFSQGRLVFEKPNSEFNKDFEDGDTYAVNVSDFLFLSEPYPDDLEKALRDRQNALKDGFTFDSSSKLFRKR